MERTEHKNIISQLLGMVAADHQATASELLTQLSEDYDQVMTASEQATENVATLTANNETLRQVNAKLFLKVGSIDNDPKPNPNTDPKPDEPALTFDGLFNEKGELL